MTYLIAEIGINHDGDIRRAKMLIDLAIKHGFDAVKFQKRTPELCVPQEQWDAPRQWQGQTMKYIDYKRYIELKADHWRQIQLHCKAQGIDWFASCWDLPSLEFVESLNPCAHKVASACLTDHELLRAIRKTRRKVYVSTGMSTIHEIDAAMDILYDSDVVLMHSTSAYPCPPEAINMLCVPNLQNRYRCEIGYSGHEEGVGPTPGMAVMAGATAIERHITDDRTREGTDHAASLGPEGMEAFVRDVRVAEIARGDGVKRVFDCELASKAKLRRVG